MSDVIFFEAFEEEAQTLKNMLGAEAICGVFTEDTIQESTWATAETAPVPVISVRTQSLIPLEWADSLDAILSRSTGYDHLVRYHEQRPDANVKLGYLPLYCARAVAEHAMLLWMMLMRRVKLQTAQFATFCRNGLTGDEVLGKTISIFGVGNIGAEIVTIANGLGMQVLGVDIEQKHPQVKYVKPEEAVERGDIIVCAMNLTEFNHGYFSLPFLNRVKSGALFVNVARGELSPQTDLLMALNDGLLSGVGLDVFDHESQLAAFLRAQQAGTDLSASDPEVKATLELVQRDDVVFTPHNAFNTRESVQRKSEQSVRQINSLRTRRRFVWPVPF